MEIFAGIGLAVGGIFATIVLAGMLAGIIAFGLMDLGIRTRVQRKVVKRKIDDRVTEADPEGDAIIFETVRVSGPSEMYELRDLAKRGDAVPALLHMSPDQLFGLPYRQLCGQIAARINREMISLDGPYPYRGLVTALFALAHERQLTDKQSIIHDQWFKPDERALAAVDRLQIDLGNAVLRTANWVAGCIVALLFFALYIPTASQMAFFADSSYAMSRAAGGALAAVVSLTLLLAFAFGAVVVATLTFRWIDRLASAR